MGDSQEQIAVPEEWLLNPRVAAQVRHGPADGRTCLVNPRTQFGIAAMEVAELMSQNGAQFRNFEYAHL
jgi:hypothetical protein